MSGRCSPSCAGIGRVLVVFCLGSLGGWGGGFCLFPPGWPLGAFLGLVSRLLWRGVGVFVFASPDGLALSPFYCSFFRRLFFGAASGVLSRGLSFWWFLLASFDGYSVVSVQFYLYIYIYFAIQKKKRNMINLSVCLGIRHFLFFILITKPSYCFHFAFLSQIVVKGTVKTKVFLFFICNKKENAYSSVILMYLILHVCSNAYLPKVIALHLKVLFHPTLVFSFDKYFPSTWSVK